MTRHALLAGLVALTLSGCFSFLDGGPEVSETRSLEPFTRVRIDDGIPAKFSPGAPSVTINTQQKVLDNLETTVKDGQLLVQLKVGVTVSSFSWTDVVITGEGVTSLEVTGGSRLEASGLDTQPLRLNASGGSQLSVSGRSADARFNASGASKISAFELAATAVSVEASGGSTLEVNASQSVEGTASGGSRVVVEGAADTTAISTSGGSTVSRRQ
ncbi:MAG: GIN domain-containing protein [Myxococcota bacterium]